ncbi:MAG: hypothetical protein JNK82_19760 [Myxococcaceae bacterium]|nr:hypothetical protein [Myxococcaceae bacterium]
MKTVDGWKSALRAALKEAMRARQPQVVAVMRETLAAIDNAEAADLTAAPAVQQGVIAGGVAGLGAGEVQRRSLTPEAVEAIVARELAELRAAAASYEGLGRGDEAAALRSKAEALERLHSSAEP